MVNLRKITHENVAECMNLEVTKEQISFVAVNVDSLVDAYVSITNNGFATPYAVYSDDTSDDTVVGFIMYTYFVKESVPIFVDIKNAPCYYIWRLMIDKNHQGKGYGKQAVEKIIAEIKTMPHGEAKNIFTSYEPDNIASKNLFKSFGFYETGEVEGDIESNDYEVIAKLDI